jgi:4-amino-4-deoxy-L-arabinose transferase-like glycosyltransferase
MSTHRWLFLSIIIATAIGFRFYHLQATPPGLFLDEAIEGNQALELLATHHFQVFYPENYGREGLFVWLAAIPLKIFGNHAWALRSVSAVFGVLTVVGLYFLVCHLHNEETALIAGFLLATSFWHTSFSRLAFRAILAPFFVVWGLYFLVRGFKKRQLHDFVLSGLFWGLGFYTYIAFRVMPFVLVVAAVCYYREQKTTHRALALLLAAFAIVLAPLAWHFIEHPADFSNRIEEVSIWSRPQPVVVLLTNIVKTAGMFNFKGDSNWRHNYSGSPALPVTLGLFFVIGLILAVSDLFRRGEHGRRSWSPPAAVTLSWFAAGLLPAILSSQAPHALRAVIVAPVAYVFVADGIWRSYVYVSRRYRSVRFEPGYVFPVMLGALLLSTTLLEARKYFIAWANQPVTSLVFFKGYADLGDALNAIPSSTPKYICAAPGAYLSINGIPILAQSVMFITDTCTREKQAAKNFHYVTALPENVPPGSVVVRLTN